MKDYVIYALLALAFIGAPIYCGVSYLQAKRFEAITGQSVSWTDALILDLVVVGWEKGK